MKTLQELFSFMRKNGFEKASWDNQLTLYPSVSAKQMPDLVEELGALDDNMLNQFGDRTGKPLWFHV